MVQGSVGQELSMNQGRMGCLEESHKQYIAKEKNHEPGGHELRGKVRECYIAKIWRFRWY